MLLRFKSQMKQWTQFWFSWILRGMVSPACTDRRQWFWNFPLPVKREIFLKVPLDSQHRSPMEKRTSQSGVLHFKNRKKNLRTHEEPRSKYEDVSVWIFAEKTRPAFAASFSKEGGGAFESNFNTDDTHYVRSSGCECQTFPQFFTKSKSVFRLQRIFSDSKLITTQAIFRAAILGSNFIVCGK